MESIVQCFLKAEMRNTPKKGQPDKGERKKCKKNGASDRNRTGDNHVGNVMLYQLSYTRIC